MNTFGRGDFRIPRDLPMVLQSGKSQPGIGRGFGRGAPVAAADPPQPGNMPSLVPRYPDAETSGSWNATPDAGHHEMPGAGFLGGARNEATFPSAAAVPSYLPPPGFPSCMGRGVGPQGNERPPGYVKFKDALANANQPLREIEEYDKLRATFIPGHHIPGQNFPVLPEKLSKAVNRIEIPDDLIRQYRGGTKNPVSAVEEFLKKLKLDGVIKETPVEDMSMSNFGSFGYTCVIEGKKFPQGVARKKKDAKIAAARNAFDSILRDGFSVLKATDVIAPSGGGGGTEAAAEAGDSAFEVKPSGMTFGNTSSPASMFNEYCAKNGITSTITVSDGKTVNGFECEIRIKNQRVALVCATSKKDAKTRACDEALRVLMNQTMPTNEMTHFDSMAALAKAKLVELQRRYAVNISNYNVLAAFVVMMFNGDKGRVVALATGSGCPKGLELRTDGKVVVDCHAEVLARRALVKWFVKQLTQAVDSMKRNQSSPEDCVFAINDTGDKFRLKDTVSIHMYISNAPCGDASVFPVAMKRTIITPEELDLMYSGEHQPTFDLSFDHGCLRVKGEDGQMTAKTLGAAVHRGASLEEENLIDAVRFRTMSCSDKILKWNVLGLQGSLGSHMLEPVYLNSISLGNNFDFGHMTRAVCCRVMDTVRDYLPVGFDLRHPLVGRVSVYEPTPVQPSKIAINWSDADTDVEIISTVTGQTVNESPFHTGADPSASRLCKFGFGFRFRALAKLFHQDHLLDHPTYGALKDAAQGYNAVKETLYDHLESSEYGAWMKRAADLDTFSFES